uniref:Uncharacterized protein n=1 Tax=Lepeophtheirus salmonis TaxID=72036 RepID=A0A0K2UG97_LEPSM
MQIRRRKSEFPVRDSHAQVLVLPNNAPPPLHKPRPAIHREIHAHVTRLFVQIDHLRHHHRQLGPEGFQNMKVCLFQ